MRDDAGGVRKTSYHHGNLRLALIERSLALLEERGAAGLSLRYLARQLGVSQTAPYHHFADKNALLAALVAEGFRQLARNVERAPLEKFDLERRITGLCSGLVRFARERPELFRLMFGSQVIDRRHFPELMEAASASYRTLAGRVRETFEECGMAGLDADTAAMAIWSMGYGLATIILNERLSPEAAAIVGDGRALVRQVTALLAAGIAVQKSQE